MSRLLEIYDLTKITTELDFKSSKKKKAQTMWNEKCIQNAIILTENLFI